MVQAGRWNPCFVTPRRLSLRSCAFAQLAGLWQSTYRGPRQRPQNNFQRILRQRSPLILATLNSLAGLLAVFWNYASHMASPGQLIICETMMWWPRLQRFVTYRGARNWRALTFMHHSRLLIGCVVLAVRLWQILPLILTGRLCLVSRRRGG